MKYNKLPKLEILNPFSDSPIVKTTISKVGVFAKIFLIVAFVATILLGGFYLNVQHEQSIIRTQQIQLETSKAAKAESGVVIDATAAIINRDGNVPINVAKKYATWIYEAGAKYSVDPVLILSVMFVESKFNYRAISPTGPIGLLQIASSYHKEKTTQAALFDPKNNIHVGAWILKEYADKSSTDVETLLRFNGSLGHAPVYAVKVLSAKSKYNQEILDAIVRSI